MGEELVNRFAIGDVHGHYDALMQLVRLMGLRSGDRLFFLGDLIDRGPQSAAVVDWVMRHGHHCLRGNHEEMCLLAHVRRAASSAWHSWLVNGGTTTLESYGLDGVSTSHLTWLQQLPLYLDLGDVFLVHAGVHPDLELQDQTAAHFCWIREEFHASDRPFFDSKIIITGHTVTFAFPHVHPGQIAVGTGWIGIETGAYHPRSGWLTALNLDSALVYQVNALTGIERKLHLSELAAPVQPLPRPTPRGMKRGRGAFA
ncbi:MAG: serine/threonine protein phosphatase [Oscillatoriales cyanobacterium SM2_2_1]|nr:serine/threonine protein phosphatase [Oscillatoriales cyanobacterium SM2_2_1]